MQSPQAQLKEITRLLACWPSAVGEGDEQLRAYLIAVEDYLPQDIEAGVNSLIKGNAPGVNPNFLPSPAAVGSEVRRMLNLRLDREHRDRLANPRLPAPDIEHDPESRARVKAKVDEFVADMADKFRTPEAAADHLRKSQQWARTNSRFVPDMDPDAMRRRLMPYTAGDPEGEADAA